MYMYMSCVYLYMYKGKEGGLERGRRGRLCGARTRTLVKLFCARFLSDSWHVQLPGRLRCVGAGAGQWEAHRTDLLLSLLAEQEDGRSFLKRLSYLESFSSW